jgi:di/tricarboxylate transporter
VVLQAGDRLIVEGRLERMDELSSWRQMEVEKEGVEINQLFSKNMDVAEVQLSPSSGFVGRTLNEIGFHSRHEASVLAIRRKGVPRRSNLQDEPLETNDTLLIYGLRERLEPMKDMTEFTHFRFIPVSELKDTYRLQERLLVTRVPEISILTGKPLKESRLGDALAMRVLCIVREDGTKLIAEPEVQLLAGDRLMMMGKLEDLLILKGLEELEIEHEALPDVSELESARVGLVEGMLSPRTTVAGKTLRQLNFREKYGLSVLAIWREGHAYRSNLRDMALRFGDAFLLYGPRDKLGMLGREPDFLVLTEAAQEIPRLEKAKISTIIMGGVLLPVVLGLVPISIGAVVGAAFMVLFRCLTMEEAYRSIEWKAVFLIAGMLPLGTALDQTGAAKFLAQGVVSSVGPFGPMAVLAGLLSLTFLATCFIPTAALVVLMAPIVINTSVDMGLSPYALMMAIAMAASASFMTPISHPANILVMGPGGYRFIDYLKAGIPLSLVVLLVVMLVLPLFWPILR